MFKTVAFHTLRSLGWLLAFAGLIMPGMLIIDHFTATPTRASIAEVGHHCEKRVCLLGRCNWERIECATMDALSATGQEVRHKRRAKVAFQSDEGKSEAWASYTKLKLKSPKVGDKIDILYRGPAPYYIAPPFSYEDAGIGLVVSLLGGLLLVLTGRWRKPDAT